MGFDDGGIILDRQDETYYTGQTVSGRLEFDLSNVKTFRGIYIEFKGFCEVHWTTSRSRRENDRTIHYTVAHHSYEDYVNLTTYLAGSKSGEHQLHPGKHVFPFQFPIPPHCPSSFEGSYGHVRYKLKATCDRAFKLDQHKSATFRVISPLDLNANPYCREPIGMEFYQSFCCWCLSAGKCEVIIKVPAGGACPQQVLPIEIRCKNDSNVEIDAIKLEIKKYIEFRAASEPGTQSEQDTVLEVKKGPFPARTERNYVVDFTVPDLDAPNLTGCRYIDVDFKFKVKVESSGCHTDEDDSRPFIIGTIPLSGTALPLSPIENIPVTQGINPYPITNQPIFGNQPYPNENPPYPNPNVSPYPAPGIGINPQTSPYPNANPPYPNPYPSGNAPFTSPFPSNPPYPNASPYPPNGTNLPYPANNSPYPNPTPYPPNTGQSPYPANVGPTSPYPGSKAPYPTDQPLQQSGFVQGNNEVTVPLLPPTGGVPYPSPYASASAPEPSTPDDEGKKLLNPPFNPDFKE